MKQIADELNPVFSFEQLQAQADDVVRPARVYMADQEIEHAATINVFRPVPPSSRFYRDRCASLFNPTVAKTWAITPAALRILLAAIPWIDDNTRRLLEQELVAYKAACDVVEGDVQVLHLSRLN
jgi:hypothetical protein